MKIKKLLAAAVAMLCTAGAWAQTDVTSTYLTNADFSQGPVVTVDIRGYGKDMQSGDVYGFQEVTGWQYVVVAGDNKDASYPNSGMGAGVLAYGSTNQLKGNSVAAPAAGPDASAGNGLGFFAVWSCGGYYYQDVTLPAGNYTLTIPVYNISGTSAGTTYTGFFPTSGENNKTVSNNPTVGKWTSQTVSFTLAEETTGQIRLGYKSAGGVSGANPHLVFDGVKIFAITALELAQQEALALVPETAGDDFFTMGQAAIDDFTQRINNATTVEAVEAIKDEITNWVAPATNGTWNVKNVTAAGYLGTDGENVVLSEIPVAITFEKAATAKFYIKAGENYINMKGGGNNTWSMSATSTASTTWEFTLADGKYTIKGPNGLIGTDATAVGSTCYGDKAAGNNGEWTISEAISEEQIAITVAKNALQAALNAVAVPTANIGDGAFQYKEADVTALAAKVAAAQSVLENETATLEEIEAQTAIISALSIELNAPDPAQAYNLVFNCDGHTATGNALTLIPNPAQTQGLYGLKYLAPANVNLAQAFYFTHTTGNKYKVHAIGTDGNARYITTATLGYNRDNFHEGLRLIEDADKALEIEVRSSSEGEYRLWNTLKDKAIAHNGSNNNDAFTNYDATFNLLETTKPSVTVNTTATGYATVIFPFSGVELPEGVTANTVAVDEDGKTLVLTPAETVEANKPYVIEGIVNETFTGDAKGVELTYTEGLLTGVYAETVAPVGSYVLQNLNDVVAFYQVAEGAQPTVKANRAYLTASAGEVKVFFLGGNADAIQTVEAEKAENGAIYNLAGQRVEKAVKGIYVINGKKVIVK